MTEDDENMREAEKWFEDYMELAGHTNPTIRDAFITGWNQHRAKCKNLYSMEDIKNIIN
jgi:hypothetical protein